jgi:hypothetical protein
MELPIDIKHPAWITSISTVISYSLGLMLLTALVFGIPYVIFLLL